MSYDDLERMLRNLYPRIAASLDRNIVVEYAGDNVYRVGQRGQDDAEWFGTREEATEARRARILHLLLLWHGWQQQLQATRGGA